MKARVVIGANRSFALRNAVLLYGDGQRCSPRSTP